MALIGQVDFPHGLIGSMGCGLFSLVGEDGQHYAPATFTFGDVLNIACAESESYFAISYDTWANDFDSLGFGGAVGHHYAVTHTIPVTGTPYFLAVGWGDGAVSDDVVGVEYKIVSDGVVVVTGGFRYVCAAGFPQRYIGSFRTNSHSYGAALINGKVYAVCDTGGTFFDFDGSFKLHLIELTLNATSQDMTTGSWTSHITELPWEWGFGRAQGGREYTSRMTVYEHPDGIGVFSYINQGLVDGGGDGLSPTIAALDEVAILATVVNPAAHTTTGSNNVSADWGLPFSDMLLRYDGALSASYRDDYVSPNVGSDGVFYWARSFTDDHRQCRVRMFTLDINGDPVAGDVRTFQFTDETVPPGLNELIEFVQGFIENGDLLWMARSLTAYIFGSEADFTTLPPEIPVQPPPETPTENPDTGEGDLTQLELAELDLVVQRWLLRTGHIRKLGEISVDDLRLIIKRGLGDSETAPMILVRANRDNKGFGPWAKKSLGKVGDKVLILAFGGFGTARDWQFEVATTDDCPIELRKLEILPTQLGH